MKLGLDTNVLVAVSAPWHEHHNATHEALTAAVKNKVRLYVASHVLLEWYAVLTRLPPRIRFSPEQALALITANLELLHEVTTKRPNTHTLLTEAVRLNISGGRIYDMAIADALAQADVQEIWTYNVAHFSGIVPADIIVSEPRILASH